MPKLMLTVSWCLSQRLFQLIIWLGLASLRERNVCPHMFYHNDQHLKPLPSLPSPNTNTKYKYKYKYIYKYKYKYKYKYRDILKNFVRCSEVFVAVQHWIDVQWYSLQHTMQCCPQPNLQLGNLTMQKRRVQTFSMVVLKWIDVQSRS